MILNVVADARYLREKARADYLDAERGLFERWGPTAGRNLTDDDRRLLAVQGKAVGWKRLTKIAHIATAQTIRRWHRKLIGITRAKSGGKPQTSPVVEALVVKLAVENSYGNDSWGRRRIAGALLALGHDLDAGTVRNILRRHGIPPAPNRGRGRDNDLQMAVETLADIAIDFAQTVVIDAGRICRLYILLAIHIQTREAVLVGITEHPTEAWMLQCARNLTMAEVGFLQLTKAASIQMDHDAIFTAHFRKTLADAGLDVRFTPRRQPWKNGHIERFIQTLKNLVLHKFWLPENLAAEIPEILAGARPAGP